MADDLFYIYLYRLEAPVVASTGREVARPSQWGFGLTTSRSVLTLPGTEAEIHPPHAQRKRAGPSVSAPGWSATPETR